MGARDIRSHSARHCQWLITIVEAQPFNEQIFFWNETIGVMVGLVLASRITPVFMGDWDTVSGVALSTLVTSFQYGF